MLRSKVITACTAVGLCLSLGACQTAQSLRAQFVSNTYEDVEGKFIDQAQGRVVPDLEENMATRFMDRYTFTDGGETVGFNVAERVRNRKDMEAQLAMGLSAVEVEKTALRKDEYVELEGRGVEHLKRYIQSVLGRLQAQWPYEPMSPELTLSIVDDDAYNASMSPLNVMRIHLGVLLNSESEDELAAILAHELTHGYLRHYNAQDWKGVENKAFNMAMMTAASYLNDNGATQNTLMGLMMAEKGLRRLNNEVLYPAWGRHLEDEADLMAADLLVRAGYNWMELNVALERIGDQDRQRAEQRKEKERLIEEERKFAAQNGGFSQAWAASLEAVSVKLGNLGAELGKGHADAEDRLRNVRSYTRREYRRVSVPTRSIEPYTKAIFEGPGFLAIKKRVFIRDAEQALEDQDYGKAVEFGFKALNGNGDPDPRVRKVLYKARLSQGQRAKAIENLEISRKGGQATLEIYDLLTDRYVEDQAWDKAVGTWLERNRKFPLSESEVIPRLIELYVRAGDMQAATAELQKCVARSEQAPRLATRCQMAYENAINPPGAGKGEDRKNDDGANPGKKKGHAKI